jgi:hypothetical protein
MKNNIRTLLALSVFFFASLVANAQSSKKVNMKKPESVALAFMQRFTEFEFEKAKALTTEESKQMFSFLEMALSGSGEEEMKKAKEEAKENAKNLKKATCKINNDEASCSFCCDTNNQPIVDSELKLKKVKGKWYVHMSKEDMMNGEGMNEENVVPDGE